MRQGSGEPSARPTQWAGGPVSLHRGGVRPFFLFRLDLGCGLLRRLLLLSPSLAPARATGGQLRRREVLGKCLRDVLERAESLARGFDELRRAGGISLRGGEKCGAHLHRELKRGVDELRGVLLVPVTAGICERAEQTL